MNTKSYSAEDSFTVEEIAAERNRLLLQKKHCNIYKNAGIILAVLLVGVIFGWRFSDRTNQAGDSAEKVSNSMSTDEEDSGEDFVSNSQDSQINTEATDGNPSDKKEEEETDNKASESVEEVDENFEVLTGTVDVQTYLNVRNGGGLDCEIIGALLPGALVTVIEEEDGWYRIEISEVIGYVCGDYLEVTDP